MGLFDKRVAFKPFEYPDVTKFKDAINHSYWLVSEWNFTSDVQDFHTRLNASERAAIKNTMLAIAQIEVAVKKFWTNLGNHFPKAEFDQVGVSFGESEIRHADAYSHLLQVLGFNEEFDKLLDVPAIRGRVDYLTKYLKGASADDKQMYTLTLTLFSIFIENVSLFSQFLIMKSFNKYKNALKDIDNVVQATQKEEVLHALFGVYLTKLIKKEYPDWFNEEFYGVIRKASLKAFEAEQKIVDWIFQEGELDFLSKAQVIEFIKNRFNQSLMLLDMEPIFDVNPDLIKDLTWFDEEIHAETTVDFFYKKPVTYSKKTQSITAGDLF